MGPDKFYKYRLTALCYTSFLAFGLVYSVVGPSIPDMCERLSVTAADIAGVLSINAAACLIVPLITGHIIDRFPGQLELLLSASLLCVGVFTVIIPSAPLYSVYLLGNLGQAASLILCDQASNLLLLSTWGEENNSPLTGLHAMFGVGFTFGPLIIRPYLSSTHPYDHPALGTTNINVTLGQNETVLDVLRDNLSEVNETMSKNAGLVKQIQENLSHGAGTKNSTENENESLLELIRDNVSAANSSMSENEAILDVLKQYLPISNDTAAFNFTNVQNETALESLISSLGLNASSTQHQNNTWHLSGSNSTLHFHHEGDMDLNPAASFSVSRIEIAYCIVATSAFLGAFLAMVSYWLGPPSGYDKIHSPPTEGVRDVLRSDNCLGSQRSTTIILMVAFWFFYVWNAGRENIFNTWLFNYAVSSDLHFTKQDAALLDFTVKLAFLVGRLIATFVALRVSVKVMLFCELYGALVACICMVAFGATSRVYLWVFACLSSMIGAPVWPAGIAWMDTYHEVTGVTLILLNTGANTGLLVFHYVSGWIFTHGRPEEALYLVLVCSAMLCVQIVFMQYVASRHGTRSTAPGTAPATTTSLPIAKANTTERAEEKIQLLKK